MIKEKNMYKPLPDSLTIKQSKVNGLGLFAKQGIAQGTNLGTTHIKVGEAIIRTPLGGFINHANEANCVKVELHDEIYVVIGVKKKWNLITLKNIKEGEEITVRYTFYKI
jgi:SET domain-containing protein